MDDVKSKVGGAVEKVLSFPSWVAYVTSPGSLTARLSAFVKRVLDELSPEIDAMAAGWISEEKHKKQLQTVTDAANAALKLECEGAQERETALRDEITRLRQQLEPDSIPEAGTQPTHPVVDPELNEAREALWQRCWRKLALPQLKRDRLSNERIPYGGKEIAKRSFLRYILCLAFASRIRAGEMTEEDAYEQFKAKAENLLDEHPVESPSQTPMADPGQTAETATQTPAPPAGTFANKLQQLMGGGS